MRYLRKRLQKWRNPGNLTRLHLKDYVDKHGFDIGDFSYGAPTIRWWGEKVTLRIGRFCSIADGVRIFLGGNHRTDWVTSYPFSGLSRLWPEVAANPEVVMSRGDVRIGADVWIGSQATILSGVTIGHGAVIAAGAMVTRDVSPYAIVAGNPAREVRKRFADAQIEALLKTQWWELSRGEILPLIPLLQQGDVEAFVTAFHAR